MDLPVVTPENYYSPEMNMAYMGSTQFKAFEKCEAAALAELRGEYTPPTSQAFLVGGYIDAWFSGELPLYQAQHPEIFKRDGIKEGKVEPRRCEHCAYCRATKCLTAILDYREMNYLAE